MAATDTYVEAIRTFVVEEFLEGSGDDLERDTPLLELGILDSFSIVELVGFVQRRFGVRIPESELQPANLATLETLGRLVERLDGGT